MFVECPAFRRAPRRPQSTNTAQQQRNLFKLMAMAAPVCQRRRFPLQPSAFIQSPPPMFHPSIVLRCLCLSFSDPIFLTSAISLPALRFCSSISSVFRSSSGLQSHAFIHSSPLILPHLPSFSTLLTFASSLPALRFSSSISSAVRPVRSAPMHVVRSSLFIGVDLIHPSDSYQN